MLHSKPLGNGASGALYVRIASSISSEMPGAKMSFCNELASPEREDASGVEDVDVDGDGVAEAVRACSGELGNELLPSLRRLRMKAGIADRFTVSIPSEPVLIGGRNARYEGGHVHCGSCLEESRFRGRYDGLRSGKRSTPSLAARDWRRWR